MTVHEHDPIDPGYRFCPKCGGGLEKKVVEAHDPRERLYCARCGFIFYLDPKLSVGTIVTGGEGFLLLRRAIGPGYGRWVFPGGYVDRGETVEEAAEREALEETGVRIALGPLVGIYSYARRGIVVIVYEATVVSGDPHETSEALEVRWFAPEAVPWDDLAFPSTRSGLKDYFDRHGLADAVPGRLDPGDGF